jgi:hypothetical protein
MKRTREIGFGVGGVEVGKMHIDADGLDKRISGTGGVAAKRLLSIRAASEADSH